jgi:hypothetical protein
MRAPLLRPTLAAPGPHGEETGNAVAAMTALRSLQESPTARARRPRSRVPRGFFRFSRLRPVTCFLSAAEQEARLSLRAFTLDGLGRHGDERSLFLLSQAGAHALGSQWS